MRGERSVARYRFREVRGGLFFILLFGLMITVAAFRPGLPEWLRLIHGGATTPAPASTPPVMSSSPTMVPPGASPPAFLRPPPESPGRLLAWVFRRRSFDPSAPDPANGQEIRGEVFLEVGNDEKPARMHGRFWLPDGRLYAEIWRTAAVGWEARFMDPGGPVCFQEPSSPEAMRWAFPPFVDLGKLRADGWEPTSEERTGFDLPAPRSLEGAAPERIWGEGPVTWWRRTVRWEGGWVERAWMAISEDGQLRAVRQERREAGGQRHSDEERVYGPVWVLRPDPRGELLLQPSPEMARICESEKGKAGGTP
jgi:hypothetical protein